MTLASLGETEAPVISCYLNLELGETGWRNAFEERVRLLKASLTGTARPLFEEGLQKIERFVGSGLHAGAKGAAIFSRGGRRPFFRQLQFQVPLPNWVAVASTPNIYHLVELKDTYHRYVVMISTEESVRVLGVNLGAVTEQAWRTRPELRRRVGREWTKQHYQSHRAERANRFVNEQIRVLDHLMSSGGYAHLILAGNPRVTAQVKKALPRHLVARLVDIVHASQDDRTSDVVSATLASFIEAEERESVAVVEKLQSEIHRHGLAVAGTAASYQALREGRADILILAKTYDPGAAWTCGRCGVSDVGKPIPNSCVLCGAKAIREFSVKEDMVRIAERVGCKVEVVNQSDVLMQLGGVGCLLRYFAWEQHIKAS
jgi:hypothetical protein